MAKRRKVLGIREASRDRKPTTHEGVVEKKKSPPLSKAELLAEDLFFKNICDTVEHETEIGTTFHTPRKKVN